jgi:hypothetical protein
MTIHTTYNPFGTVAIIRNLSLGILFLLAAPLLSAQPVQLDFPSDSPGIPAYARMNTFYENSNLPRTADWAAVVFYRNTDCVPLDFDLGQLFHLPGPAGPGAFGCDLLVEGTELWANGPDQGDLAPIYARTRNAVAALPIWFVAWDEISVLLDTGSIFIDEIESLPSLIRGRAWWFEEYLKPDESAADPAISMRAEGRLENGGRFFLSWHEHPGEGEDVVVINLELEGGPKPTKPPSCFKHPNLPNPNC